MSNLPTSWIAINFTDIFDIEGGTQPPKSTFVYEQTVGYVRLLQIRDFGAKPFPTYIPDKKNLKKCEKDDILIGRYGASVGRICTGMAGAYNVALTKVIIPKEVERRFVYYLLNSPLFQRAITSFERSAQDGFNKDDLNGISVPLAPLKEQRRIVAKLDEILPKIQACKERIEIVVGSDVGSKMGGHLNRLKESILLSAFSGNLVPQDPTDEPASVLLERLKSAPAAPVRRGRKAARE